MAKKVYIGVDSKAREVKKIYVGVSGIARKVKKGYIGIGGVAMQFFKGYDGVDYYGKTPKPMQYARQQYAAASVGDCALFAGGRYNNDIYRLIDVYDRSLTKRNNLNLDYLGWGMYDLAGVSFGEYALFGGGQYLYNSSAVYANQLTAFNTSLTQQSADKLQNGRSRLGAACSGSYALFAGGSNSIDTGGVTYVDAYDKSLVHSFLTDLPRGGAGVLGARVGNYALLINGVLHCAYNDSLSQVNVPASTIQYRNGITSIGGCALIGGSPDYSEAYDASLTKINVASLTGLRSDGAAVSIGKYALFGGGYFPGNPDSYEERESKVVDVYDESLTKFQPLSLSQQRQWLAAAAAGNYALFGGGYYYTSESSASIGSMVDVFEA